MGLFQQSVLNKYLNEASQTEMKAAYQNNTYRLQALSVTYACSFHQNAT